ncbi:MAG: PHP domain-containing protein [Coriobacteriales bacterium]|nr:PHP domain-containing protein [Coriobacteriales bacterium]
MGTETGRYRRAIIELHCHTDHSDGLMSPSELLSKAAERGLTHISITDHDTVSGYCVARNIMPEGMTLIPGIEISSRYKGRDLHMLGYFIDVENQDLLDECSATRARRRVATLKIIDNLKAAGYDISPEELESQEMEINRSNVARIMVDKGYAPDHDSAFDTFVGRRTPYYVDRDEMDSFLALELILGAGGVPVIAHPAFYHVIDAIDPLMEKGLMGIECFHSEQTDEESNSLIEFAKERGLLITGGSDYHGDVVHPGALAEFQPPDECIDELFAFGAERGFDMGRLM